MIKNRLLIRFVFLAATVAVLGTAYGLARQSGIFGTPGDKQVAAADPWKILQQIHQYYERDSAFTQTYSIRLYNEKAPGSALEQYDCIFYSGHDQVYSRLGPAETYCDKDMLVTADPDNKMMTVMPSQPELLTRNIPAIKELKKLATEMKGELGVVEEKGKQVLTFKADFDTDIKSYRVYFDPLTYAINAIKMEVWKEDAYLHQDPEPLTLDIQFGPLRSLNNFPETFGRSRFLQFSGDTISLHPDYFDFELINQLNIPVK